jgi:spermidine synthase
VKQSEILRQKRMARERNFLRVCLFATGACTLVLEIIGTRLISPYYGSSLYSWSALITVTLISLAGGYHWGGRLADRTPALTLAARLLAGGALSVAAAPILRVPALQAAEPLGVQIGALVSALVLVAPALILLSAIGPLAVRLVAESVDKVGRSTGEIYGISTAGSVLGAVLAGFVLIPNLGLSQILYGIAILLLLLSTWAHHLSQERLPLSQPAIAAAVALYGFWPRPVPATNILRNEESAYGQVKIMDFAGTRYLLVNGTTQAMAVLPDLHSDSQYAHVMELAALVRPGAKRGLMIGLGAGLMSGALEKEYGLTMDSVELDPAMERAARDYFGFAPKGRVFIEDGRRFLDDARRPEASERYDLIFLDAFGSESPPFHMFTRESFESLRKRLTPDGIVAINLVSAMSGRSSKAWHSTHRTLAAVFPEVAVYQASKPLEDLGNVVFFAGSGRLPRPGRRAWKARPAIREHLDYALEHPLAPDSAFGVLLTDDFAPMEALLAETSTRWRRQLQRKVGEIMLY